MRKLIIWNMVTLDGFFEGTKPWSLEWHEKGWGPELQRFSQDQAAEVGMLLFGRKTYEGMAAHWPKAKGETAAFMNRVPKVVFSNTLASADWSNTRLVKGRAEDEVARLKQETGKDLLILGSAELVDSLAKRGLVDEHRLGLTPVLLGAGNPLFKPGNPTSLKLLEARPLSTGAVLLRYST